MTDTFENFKKSVLEEFKYKFYGANSPKVLDMADFLVEKLEEAFVIGKVEAIDFRN